MAHRRGADRDHAAAGGARQRHHTAVGRGAGRCGGSFTATAAHLRAVQGTYLLHVRYKSLCVNVRAELSWKLRISRMAERKRKC